MTRARTTAAVLRSKAADDTAKLPVSQHVGGPVNSTVRETLERLMADLAISQERISEVLGSSAPMTERLVKGVRPTVPNPIVRYRIAELQRLATDDSMTEDRKTAELQRIAADPGPLPTALQTPTVTLPEHPPAAAFRTCPAYAALALIVLHGLILLALCGGRHLGHGTNTNTRLIGVH